MCMNAIELLLNATCCGVTMEKNAFVWKLISAHEHLWVSVTTTWTLLSMHYCLRVSIEHPLNAIECTWMPLSKYEQPQNTHWVFMNAHECELTASEHLWVCTKCVNTNWVCANAIELLLNATHHVVTMRKNAFVWKLNSPWTWLCTDIFEWVWTPPECSWACVNAFEWVLNTLCMLLSVHEWLWWV